jgi:hypothetical protein
VRFPAPVTVALSSPNVVSLLRTLLDEVNIAVHRDHDSGHADLVLRWKGGAITELAIPIKRTPPRRLRTDEHTVDLIRRLAVHYPDARIAGILNRQHRITARGIPYTASRVQSLRHHWKIPCYRPGDDPPEGELLTVADAARELGLPVHLAPLAERRVHRRRAADTRSTVADPPHLRHPRPIRRRRPRRLAGHARGHPRLRSLPPDQRVKDGRLRAVHVRTGRRKACISNHPSPKTGCSDHHNQQEEQCDHAFKNARMSRSMIRGRDRPYLHLRVDCNRAMWGARLQLPCLGHG